MMDDIGEMLVAAGMITEQQLETAKSYQEALGGNLATIMAKLGFVDENKLTEFLAMQEDLKIADVDSMVLPVALVESVPRDVILKYHVLPIHQTADTITLAVADPTEYEAIEAVQFVTGKRVEINLAVPSALNKQIQHLFDTLDGEVDDPLMRDLASDPKMKSFKVKGGAPPAAPRTKSGATKVKAKTPAINFDELAPALLPLLIEKGIVTEAELRKKLSEMS